jgi:hypothetical protein
VRDGANGAQIFLLPDSIHLFKALKTMLDNNVTIQLPHDIVKDEALPTREVN